MSTIFKKSGGTISTRLFRKVCLMIFVTVNLLAQENKECVTTTSLTIAPVVNFCGNSESPLYIPDLIYGIPHIAPIPIQICYETNSPLSAMYLETPIQRGNLHNGAQEIQTFYLLTDSPSRPTSLDPRWERGEYLGKFLKKNNRGGKFYFNLFVRLFADSTSGFGIYQNQLYIVVVDHLGRKHTKAIGLQTRLDEASLKGRLRQEEYRPELSHNVRSEGLMEFIFPSDAPEVFLQPESSTKTLVGYLPLQIYTHQDHLPCTMKLETTNEDNYFRDDKSKLVKTSYQLTPLHMQRDELKNLVWINGEDLSQCAQLISENGYHSWDLWISIYDSQKSLYENTLSLVLIDSKGNRRVQSLRVILK
ncbi:hypothetical protein JXA70_09955 [candidate division KSB1 bacterium]|nr:hypothetical protein [candidate division KSB1 bacterium]